MIQAEPGRARAATVDPAAFFDCASVTAPAQLAGLGPWGLFRDTASAPAAPALIQSFCGAAGFAGIFTDPAALPPAPCRIVVEAPVWHRCHRALRAAGITGDRAIVLYHFDNDPTGYWDFAVACGGALDSILKARGVDAETLPALADFIGYWLGGRVSHGRILPFAHMVTRDYLPVSSASAVKIVRVLAALADDESRAAYSRILFGSEEQIFGAFSANVWGPQQYMEIARLEPGDVMVNCGVSNGWELPFFLEALKGEGRILNFDPQIIYHGTGYGAMIGAFGPIVEDHRIILGDTDGEVLLPQVFAGMVRSDDAARHDGRDDGKVAFASRSLDSLMAEGLADRVDFIKMDVEGGEAHILKGAMGTIRKHRPKLAVAIYHEPDHFWDYPCLLLDALTDYRFYIRQYGYSRFETLLYAIPIEAADSGSGCEGLGRVPLPPRAPDPLPVISLHMRDKAGHARSHYAGRIRPLTRFHGIGWSGADLRPLPRVEADSVVAVHGLTSRRALILTRHAYSSDVVRLTAGVRTAGIGIDYVCDFPVAADGACAPVWSNDGVARVIVWDRSAGTARVVAYADGQLVSGPEFACSREPLAAMRGPAGTTVWLAAGKGARRAMLSDLGLSGERDAPGLDGLAGIVTITRHTPAMGSPEPALATLCARQGLRLYTPDEAPKAIAALPWDSALDLVSTAP